MQAEESVGTVRALKQIVQDHRRLFRIKLTEPSTNSFCFDETPQVFLGKFLPGAEREVIIWRWVKLPYFSPKFTLYLPFASCGSIYSVLAVHPSRPG
jgi:hypothetical protein